MHNKIVLINIHLTGARVCLGMHHWQCGLHLFCCAGSTLFQPWPVIAKNIIPEVLDTSRYEVCCLQVMGVAIHLPKHHVYSFLCNCMPASSDLQTRLIQILFLVEGISCSTPGRITTFVHLALELKNAKKTQIQEPACISLQISLQIWALFSPGQRKLLHRNTCIWKDCIPLHRCPDTTNKITYQCSHCSYCLDRLPSGGHPHLHWRRWRHHHSINHVAFCDMKKYTTSFWEGWYICIPYLLNIQKITVDVNMLLQSHKE